MNAKRRRMIQGSEVLWSTVVYIPSILLAGLLMSILGPLFAPFEVADKPLPPKGVFLFVLLLVIAAPLALRYQVWRPIAQLARDCGDRATFTRHCRTIAHRALPYAALTAVPFSLLCLNLGSWFMVLQIGLILLAEHLIEKWRAQPIRDSVDALLA